MCAVKLTIAYIKTTLGTNKMWSLYTQVVFICRFNNMESILLGTCKIWSLKASGLYKQVVLELHCLYSIDDPR